MTESNSFKGARIVFGGPVSGADEEPHDLFKIERTEGRVLYGDYIFAFAEDRNHFNVEIGPFGYVDPEYAGDLHPSRRQHFSAEECSTVEQLIRSFFSTPGVFDKQFIPRELFGAALAFGQIGLFRNRTSPNSCPIPLPRPSTTVRRRIIVPIVLTEHWRFHMAKARLKLVSPSTEVRTVTPLRVPNEDLRTREYLTEAEVEKLIEAAKKNRWGHRDSTMILIAYRHGLRAAELADLRWEQVDFRSANLHVRRVKNGTPSTHPLTGAELRALRRLEREAREAGTLTPFVFTSERGTPFTTAGFARMVERATEAAKIKIKAHPHMLRHACGYKLANDGVDTRSLQAYLGHKNIQHTVRYSELAPDRFKGFFRD